MSRLTPAPVPLTPVALTLVALTLAALAGCDAGPDDAAVLAEADKLAEPLPGLYRSTTTFESFELPGASAAAAQVAHDRMASLSPQVKQFCLTPEDATGGFRKMLAEMQDGDCVIEKFASADGRLDARMRCTAQGGIVSTIGMTGEADPQSSKIALEIEQTGAGIAGGRQRLRMSVENDRLGDCAPPGAAGTGAG